YEQYYAVINGDLSPRRRSCLSSRMQHAISLRTVAMRRQENARILYRNVANPALRFVFPQPVTQAVPFAVPVVVDSARLVHLIESRLWTSRVLSNARTGTSSSSPRPG